MYFWTYLPWFLKSTSKKNNSIIWTNEHNFSIMWPKRKQCYWHNMLLLPAQSIKAYVQYLKSKGVMNMSEKVVRLGQGLQRLNLSSHGRENLRESNVLPRLIIFLQTITFSSNWFWESGLESPCGTEGRRKS